MPSVYEKDDLISIGTLGLITSLDNFDPTRGCSLKTHVKRGISRGLYDYFRDNDHLPKNVRQKHKKFEIARISLEHELGREASDFELATKLNLSMEEYHKLTLKISSIQLESTDSVPDIDEDKAWCVVEESILKNPDNMLITHQLAAHISTCISSLTEREQVIFTLYYHESLNFREIGVILGLGLSRISQIMSEILTKLMEGLTETT